MGADGAQGGDGVVRSVDLPADADEVWRALTDVERVRDWFGAEVAWDLRPGGDVVVGPGDDGSPARLGQVDEVDRGRRLAFRWWPTEGADRHGATAVTYELVPLDEGTRLVVTEAPVASSAGRGRASASAVTPWDLRLVGLWLGCHTRALVQA